MSETLLVDDLAFEVRRSERRTTVGITVDRDGGLIVSAPAGCPLATVERSARERLLWVYTKLAQKELLRPRRPAREYVTGETFHYLGRGYRLRLVTASDTALPPLRLSQGRFLLRRDEQERAEGHFTRWYVEHGGPWLRKRAAPLAERIGVVPGAIGVRDLGFRWGSCGQGGRLNVHWRTVLLPPRIVDYILAHELVHLCELHHGRPFWRRIERAMPDYAARKQWLAEHGSRY